MLLALRAKGMKIADTLLLDYDAEAKSTRNTLERISPSLIDFKPHEKSMPMGRLAKHVAILPAFGNSILSLDNRDLATKKFPAFDL